MDAYMYAGEQVGKFILPIIIAGAGIWFSYSSYKKYKLKQSK